MAVIPEYITDEQFVRIVKKHGADKVLFGSDSPWGGQKESVEWIKRQNLTDEEKEDIFWRNAYKILIG
jgi:predicted TIM-barrel fold metal-dependent hydrolase